MTTMTRRTFIQWAGAGAVAAHTVSIADVVRAATLEQPSTGSQILVVVTLYGGNDGLNTVIPYNDAVYHAMRGTMAYREDQVFLLGESLGLNNSMAGFKTFWDNKQLAIVRGVGYPNPDRSHFSSMAIWQTASRTPSRTGWLGRWLETQPADPFRAIGLGSTLPPLLVGERRSGTALPLSGFRLPTGALATDVSRLAMTTPEDNVLKAAAARSIRDLFTVAGTVTPVLKNDAPPAADLPTAVGGNAGGDSNLSAQLNAVAKLIAVGAPTRVWSVSLGGFDTHANEQGVQSRLLGALSTSITTFMSQMRSLGRQKDVTVLVYSEFGRRVRANASDGTDHGTSGPVFLIGERINGGFFGEQPSLNQLKDDDLPVTVDFRSVYASILEDVLATSSRDILNGWTTKLPLVAPAG